MTHYHLKPEGRREWLRRQMWKVYYVLHAGEGPCVAPIVLVGDGPLRPDEAAVKYVESGAWCAARERGLLVADGDTFHVAVETTEGRAIYFEVLACVRPVFTAQKPRTVPDV